MNFLQRSFLGVYAGVKATGLLETRAANSVFLGAYFLYKKYFEDPFAGLAKKHARLFAGGHILDIGANVGYTASVFAKVLTPGWRVHAFEPDPPTFATLESVIAARKLGARVKPVWAAVGDSDGSVELWHNEKHGADHRIVTETFARSRMDRRQVVSVPRRSVDSYVAEQLSGPVQFIKIDVQGYEPAVCTGMERTLALNANAVVVIEYAPQSILELGFEPRELLVFFEQRGFAMGLLEKDGGIVQVRREMFGKIVEQREYVDLIYSRQALL